METAGMTQYGVVFLIVSSMLLLIVPRGWAPLPLLMGVCYITSAQMYMIGPFHFSPVRILIGVGVIRVIVRGERLDNGINGLDIIIVAYCTWATLSGFFHANVYSSLIFRLGLAYNVFGIYFLMRIFCTTPEDIIGVYKIAAIIFIPLAIEMLLERITGYNAYSVLGGVTQHPAMREGSIRAQGPFAHAILAGTVGADCLPMMIGLWLYHRNIASIGIAACLCIAITSSSAGPVLSALAGISALVIWKYRANMRQLRWAIALLYAFLYLIMKSPPYFLIARVDPIGGATGWHRAELIRSAFNHINEWWFAGTDYTRHWMATGVRWSPEHADITNYYLHNGVWGGLPLMLLFIALMVKGFSYVGRILLDDAIYAKQMEFMIWTLGSMLFAHAMTSISISYFDQSFIFPYLNLAAIGSAWSWSSKAMSNQGAFHSICAHNIYNTGHISKFPTPESRFHGF